MLTNIRPGGIRHENRAPLVTRARLPALAPGGQERENDADEHHKNHTLECDREPLLACSIFPEFSAIRASLYGKPLTTRFLCVNEIKWL